jgi:Na+-transporting NADH:ubiquinone oxidoreductase subunit A
MSKTVKLRKGLDIRLMGKADSVVTDFVLPSFVAIKPTDFHGLTPKMIVKEGENVKAGTILFYDKYNEQIKCASPVSGKVHAIVRGDKRRILEVVVAVDSEQQYEDFGAVSPASLSSDEVKAKLLASGLWMFIKQRPIDVVANPATTPKAIFVSAFDSSPLAPDYNFVLEGQSDDFQSGLDALTKLTTGKVHLTLNGAGTTSTVFSEAKGVQINRISGKHPAGNVGTQIHHIDPINKGEFVWTVNAQDVAIIGRSLNQGKFVAQKTLAITGSEATKPAYLKTVVGAQLNPILKNGIKGDNVRIISGNALTGTKVSVEGYLGFYDNQITLLPEGDQYKFILTDGWLGLGLNKFSASRLYPTWLVGGKKEYRLDTNLNGEERAFVVTGEMDRVFPFDIFPMQLIKAAMTDDIDGMENLGIYEVIPEDFALCEYVCTTKIDIQEKIRTALDLINEECM